MKSLPLRTAGIVALSVLALLSSQGMFAAQGRFRADAEPHPQGAVTGGIATLYAQDDLASSFDFRLGEAGAHVLDGEVVLDTAQIAFHVFEPGMLTFGFSRDANANVIDLGPGRISALERGQDAAPKLSASLFQTLLLDREGLSYLEAGSKVYRLRGGNRILDRLPSEGFYHLEPIVGHTYVVRYQPRGVGGDDQFAKFEVIGLLPDHSLTLRWAPLPMR